MRAARRRRRADHRVGRDADLVEDGADVARRRIEPVLGGEVDAGALGGRRGRRPARRRAGDDADHRRVGAVVDADLRPRTGENAGRRGDADGLAPRHGPLGSGLGHPSETGAPPSVSASSHDDRVSSVPRGRDDARGDGHVDEHVRRHAPPTSCARTHSPGTPNPSSSSSPTAYQPSSASSSQSRRRPPSRSRNGGRPRAARGASSSAAASDRSSCCSGVSSRSTTGSSEGRGCARR